MTLLINVSVAPVFPALPSDYMQFNGGLLHIQTFVLPSAHGWKPAPVSGWWGDLETGVLLRAAQGQVTMCALSMITFEGLCKCYLPSPKGTFCLSLKLVLLTILFAPTNTFIAFITLLIQNFQGLQCNLKSLILSDLVHHFPITQISPTSAPNSLTHPLASQTPSAFWPHSLC